jgi:hypothetical protein
LKLNGTHQLLVYNDDGNLSGRNINTIKSNCSEVVDLEVTARKIKEKLSIFWCFVTSMQNNRIILRELIDPLEELKYLEMTVINSN